MERIRVPKIDAVIGKIRKEKYTGEENTGVFLSKIPNNTWTIYGYGDISTACGGGYGLTNYFWHPARTGAVSIFIFLSG